MHPIWSDDYFSRCIYGYTSYLEDELVEDSCLGVGGVVYNEYVYCALSHIDVPRAFHVFSNGRSMLVLFADYHDFSICYFQFDICLQGSTCSGYTL